VKSGLWAVRTDLEEITFELLCGSCFDMMLGQKNPGVL
jgi:hypothetical protein